MRGQPLTRATSPDGRWAYTLYDGWRAALHPRAGHVAARRRASTWSCSRGAATALGAEAAGRASRLDVLGGASRSWRASTPRPTSVIPRPREAARPRAAAEAGGLPLAADRRAHRRPVAAGGGGPAAARLRRRRSEPSTQATSSSPSSDGRCPTSAVSPDRRNASPAIESRWARGRCAARGSRRAADGPRGAAAGGGR